MLIVHPTCQKYDAYPVSPSAFRWIEWPLAELNKGFNSSVEELAKSIIELTPLIRIQAQTALSHFRNRNYPQADAALKIALIDTCYLVSPVVRAFAMMYFSFALTPIVLCLTPITLMTDIVSGTREVRYAFKKCYPKEHIDLIIKKKWIASVAQHLSFFVINALFFRIARFFTNNHTSLARRYISTIGSIPLIFLAALILTLPFVSIMSLRHANGKALMFKAGFFVVRSASSLPVYHFSVLFTLNFLPQWTQPGNFSIFIDNPSNWLEHEYMDKNEEWKNYAVSDRTDLVRRNDGTEFGNFLNRFKDGVPPHELLEISDNYTEDEMKAAYRKWAMVFHPDKTQDPDAPILFKALTEANNLLKKKFEVPVETETSE